MAQAITIKIEIDDIPGELMMQADLLRTCGKILQALRTIEAPDIYVSDINNIGNIIQQSARIVGEISDHVYRVYQKLEETPHES